LTIELGELEKTVLPLVRKPNRYQGNFLNRPQREISRDGVKVALVYPDIYEIGMSHLGTRILYHLLNRMEDVRAELCFAPWPDMEAELRRRDLKLFSLESRTPLHDFDIVGFSLSYELLYTNVLNMLDLAGIPLRSSSRGGRDPLIIAGGACSVNPEPMAEFIDCFIVGEAEEAIQELVRRYRNWRSPGCDRRSLLRILSRLEGVYVPELYPKGWGSGRFVTREGGPEAPGKVHSLTVSELAEAYYPPKPLVTQSEISHDRLTVEIMRGCTRGCRFCLAGAAYRPVREKAPEQVMGEVERGIRSGGFDEVSLLSLSTPDYSSMRELMPGLVRKLAAWNARLALPSMRPESFTPELARAMCGMRKGGLTLAPEVGSDRLKRFINKDMREEEILNAIELALSSGWSSVKLYLMIGLPGESEEDLDALVGLIKRSAQIARRRRGRVNVSISAFVPKPHTPFQWEAQEPVDVLKRKIDYVRKRVPRRSARISWRETEVVFLEGVLARGDARLADVIETAFRAGCRLDSWSEYFDFDKWLAAFDSCGVSPETFLSAIEDDERLPWDHIQLPVAGKFLRSEREKARRGELTPDCRSGGCRGCGAHAAAGEDRVAHSLAPEDPLGKGEVRLLSYGRRLKKRKIGQAKQTLFRVRYSKGEELKFCSHLDLVRAVERAIRRSRIDVAVTRGFHPHYKVSFGPPLPVGICSEDEYMDLETAHAVRLSDVMALSEHLPEGLGLIEGIPLPGAPQSLMDAITHARYTVGFTRYVLETIGYAGCVDRLREFLRRRAEEILSGDSLRVRIVKKLVEKDFNIRESIEEVRIAEDPERMIEMTIAIKRGLRPEVVVEALLQDRRLDGRLLQVTRVQSLAFVDGVFVSPFELALRGTEGISRLKCGA